MSTLEDRLLAADGDNPDPSASSSTPSKLHPKLRAYLWGQCFNVAKISVWWTSLSPLILATSGRDEAIGASRVAFNLAMLIVSPVAGAVVQMKAMEAMMRWSNVGRGFIWGVGLPAAWAAVTAVASSEDLGIWMLGVIVALSLVDGILVAFSNVVDIDMGGVDLLGGQHGVEITDEIRNFMNSIHHIVFDACLLLLAPAMALLSLAVGEQAGPSTDRAVGIVSVFAGVFLIATGISHYHYRSIIRSEPTLNPENSQTLSCYGLAQEVARGAKLTLQNPPIRWRLLFLGIETALEDAVVAVVMAEYALRSSLFGNGDALHANWWTAVILSAGKLGALLAGFVMQKCWKPPDEQHLKRGYASLFFSVLLGGLSIVLLPLAYGMEQEDASGDVNNYISRGLVFGSSFLFFLFSTGPKIGFETLLQGMAANVEGSGAIFGFVGTFVTIIDSLVLMGLSVMFGAFQLEVGDGCDQDCASGNMELALWITTALYALHGVLEACFGPFLMLPNAQISQ